VGRRRFRLDSNGEMNLQINDADPLFVFARMDDLRAGRWDRVSACVLQSSRGEGVSGIAS